MPVTQAMHWQKLQHFHSGENCAFILVTNQSSQQRLQHRNAMLSIKANM